MELTWPQAQLLFEQTERDRAENQLRLMQAVHTGAGSLFDKGGKAFKRAQETLMRLIRRESNDPSDKSEQKQLRQQLAERINANR